MRGEHGVGVRALTQAGRAEVSEAKALSDSRVRHMFAAGDSPDGLELRVQPLKVQDEGA